MMEFGNTLRLAREAKGFTQAQIAEMTHMAPVTVAELEDENFGRIAAPIYGRGFVKLYCEAVGIDPKPMIDEFMAIYNGERNTGIRERKPAAVEKHQDAPPPPSTPLVQPDPVEIPEPTPAQGSEPLLSELPAPPEPIASEPPKPANVVSPATAAKEPQISRYAAPVRMESGRTFSIPPAFWRICALVAAAIVVFWGIVTGVRALYRATTSEMPAAVEPAAKPIAPPPAVTPPRADIKRESQKIPPLYIDD